MPYLESVESWNNITYENDQRIIQIENLQVLRKLPEFNI